MPRFAACSFFFAACSAISFAWRSRNAAACTRRFSRSALSFLAALAAIFCCRNFISGVITIPAAFFLRSSCSRASRSASAEGGAGFSASSSARNLRYDSSLASVPSRWSGLLRPAGTRWHTASSTRQRHIPPLLSR